MKHETLHNLQSHDCLFFGVNIDLMSSRSHAALYYLLRVKDLHQYSLSETLRLAV